MAAAEWERNCGVVGGAEGRGVGCEITLGVVVRLGMRMEINCEKRLGWLGVMGTIMTAVE